MPSESKAKTAAVSGAAAPITRGKAGAGTVQEEAAEQTPTGGDEVAEQASDEKKKPDQEKDDDETDDDKKKDEQDKPEEDKEEDLDVGGGPSEEPAPAVVDSAENAVAAEKSESTEKKKGKRDKEEDSEEDMTPEEKKEKRKTERKYRQEKATLSWANEDPDMAVYLNLPYANVDLSYPESDAGRAMKSKADTLWSKMLDFKIFLPKINAATWNNIPFRAKVAGWYECKRLELPWNVFEYNDKAQAKLAKIRQISILILLLSICCHCGHFCCFPPLPL